MNQEFPGRLTRNAAVAPEVPEPLGTCGALVPATETLAVQVVSRREADSVRTDTDPQPERSRWRQERGRPSRHREAAAPHRATLLLVDDEEILRSALERNLSFQGYRILCAVDGEDAERVFLEHATEIDAVLLDSNMPLRDGEATFHALRRLRPGLPVVLMSGFAEDGTDRLKDAGLSGFLAKPFRMSEMRRVLQEALGKLDRNGRP